MTNTYGGVEAYVLDRLSALVMNNTIDLAFSTLNAISYQEKINSKIGIRRISKLSSPLNYIKSLRCLIKKGKYDVVYCNVPFANALLYIAVKSCGCKLIVHSHNTRIEEKNATKKLVLTLYHYFSKYLFSWLIDQKYGCSIKACRWLFKESDTFTEKKNAINCKKYSYDENVRIDLRRRLHIPPSTFVVGHVGRFSYQKNHEFLIKIFNEILKVRPDSILLLIGDGEFRSDIESLCFKLKIRNKVMFLGIQQNVNELLQVMDCFLLPSRFEGLPIVGVEAQAAGLPCFFSDSISNEIKLTSLAYFKSLKESPKDWAEFILHSNLKRKDTLKELRDAGYDLKKELEELRKIK